MFELRRCLLMDCCVVFCEWMVVEGDVERGKVLKKAFEIPAGGCFGRVSTVAA